MTQPRPDLSLLAFWLALAVYTVALAAALSTLWSAP